MYVLVFNFSHTWSIHFQKPITRNNYVGHDCVGRLDLCVLIVLKTGHSE